MKKCHKSREIVLTEHKNIRPNNVDVTHPSVGIRDFEHYDDVEYKNQYETPRSPFYTD